jgi:glc operon protein GlcG
VIHNSGRRFGYVEDRQLPLDTAILGAGAKAQFGIRALKLDHYHRTGRGTGAYTQVPPDPNNPLEAVPDTVTFTPYGEPISLENAKKVAAAAAAEVAKRNWRGAFCISVADTSGELVYFERGENCQFASIAISQHKARTAARYRRPTVVFERLLGKGPYYSYLPTLDDFTGSRGGNPIIVGSKIVGAIG